MSFIMLKDKLVVDECCGTYRILGVQSADLLDSNSTDLLNFDTAGVVHHDSAGLFDYRGPVDRSPSLILSTNPRSGEHVQIRDSTSP